MKFQNVVAVLYREVCICGETILKGRNEDWKIAEVQ
jgi:hypothetical protein